MTSKPFEREKRLTRKLKLLPGLRWTGNLTVLARTEDRFIVSFDAYSPSAEQYVYDRATLTAKQLKDWTGAELS